ncbi:unnamed protein product [Clonostachys solani]|uniref:ubiquitinyl hydrolase 1 n=1 Tax=Clonostachys solani TaxID=160281 RepID=A0A9N9YWP7_9HYPO|nr:unnamed protein product [Clonostachys solani]
MANLYDLGSQQDHDASAYTQLPGAASNDAAHNNLAGAKPQTHNDGVERPGRHPSRWIYELLNNKTTNIGPFEKARQYQVDIPYDWDHEHRLVLNGNQSYSTPSTRVLSSLCIECHFHFVFKMKWNEHCQDNLCNPLQASWPMEESKYPWHHLVWAGSTDDADLLEERSKYYPLLSREQFVCVAPPCTFQITVEVLEPRMGSWWAQLLTDHDAIRKELYNAKARDPERYEGANEGWITQAPLNLNTYLKNLLESPTNDLRSISKRNKRFSVLFGPRSFRIFRDLEFSETIVMLDDEDDGQFTPRAPEPASGPSGTTEPGTYRAYVEDVRAEVQCIIHRTGQATEKPTFITSALYADLGSKDAPGAKSHALTDLERYRLLGILPNLPREATVNAYFRQWDLIPSQRKAMVNDLVAIANDYGDEALSEFAMTQSSIFESLMERMEASENNELNQALKFFDLSPPNRYTADQIIASFRLTLAGRPGQAAAARDMLMVIAGASSDPEYQTRLLMESDSNMTIDTSKALFNIPPNDVMDSQAWIQVGRSKLKSCTSRQEKLLYLSALNTIADVTDDARLKQGAAELQERFAPAGEEDDGNQAPADINIPVGLNNIGNTCYLNSLLQYLFTVKAVRDIAFNYSDYRLELTDEQIAERKIGGNKMTMDRAEAVVAQAFVHELADLFNKLRSHNQAATRPSQRLANAVLLSTHSLLEDLKSKEASTSTLPPPLPVRPTSRPPSPVAEDTEMASERNPSSQDSETVSNGSSETLVDLVTVMSDKPISEEQPSSTHQDGKPNEPTIRVVDESIAETSAIVTGEPAKNPDVDVVMSDLVDEKQQQTIDEKVLDALGHQKRSSGTDQQDVEEVIGSIINRLQAAIHPSSVDEKTGIQFEKIMETFFVTTVNYTKKFDDHTYQSEISYDRSITAFPAADGPCSLYDALGRNFDQQVLEESRLTRYTAIKSLPPVLHVLIQRSQSIGRKNDNPVVIPETLYLDRYMDAPHDSPEFKRRTEQWVVGEWLADLKQQKARLNADPKTGALLDEVRRRDESQTSDWSSAIAEARSAIASLDDQFAFDGPTTEDLITLSDQDIDSNMTDSATNNTHKPAIEPNEMATIEEFTRAQLDDDIAIFGQRLEQLVTGMEKNPYRLQAVICHRGHLSSGHYWVWIHDFEANVWRWYNDAAVKENQNTQEVLETLSKSGEPYYLCYVRDSDKGQHVNVPKRELPVVPEPAGEPLVETTEDADGDIQVNDASKEPVSTLTADEIET